MEIKFWEMKFDGTEYIDSNGFIWGLDGTKKNFSDMAQFYNITLHYVLSKQSLGRCIGKDYRAVIALNDNGFIEHLLKLINADDKK